MVTKTYRSPLGEITLAADARGLTGLWIAGQRHFGSTLDGDGVPSGLGAATSVLDYTWAWLDAYFAGHEPAYTPPLHLMGTAFQQEVWRELLKIPYGQTVSYAQIAERVYTARAAAGDDRPTSARAVGGAVGRNPVSIIVPCHRVLGADGSLTGYAGGLDIKERLLRIEGERG